MSGRDNLGSTLVVGAALAISTLGTATPAQAQDRACCEADLDGDFDVDIFDFGAFAPQFGCTGVCGPADIDCDGDVDTVDFEILCLQFGTSAPFDTSYCNPALGACCWAFDTYPGGTKQVCQDLSYLGCIALKGRFVAVGTGCATTDCENAPICLADLDGNNTCDVLDFGVFAGQFGSQGAPGICDGDFDGDGQVNVLDFSIFTQWFGCSGPPVAAQCCATIPPP